MTKRLYALHIVATDPSGGFRDAAGNEPWMEFDDSTDPPRVRLYLPLDDLEAATGAAIGATYQAKSEKAAASGYASLDGSSKVVQDPANATATATAAKIPIADGSAKLDTWVSLHNAVTVSDGEHTPGGTGGQVLSGVDASTTQKGHVKMSTYIDPADVTFAADLIAALITAGLMHAAP